MFISPLPYPRFFKPVLLNQALKILNRLEAGQLTVVMPDETEHRFCGPSAGPTARIDILSNKLFSRLFIHGEIGFAESYIEGEWETPDLQSLLDLLVTNSAQIRGRLQPTRAIALLEKLRHGLRANSKRQARKNIAHHYDLGNVFYALWLDETMTYSAGLFDGNGLNLAQSQTRKYDAIADSIDVKGNDSILEIGCGWGGFAEHVAKTRGANITALTISREQHDFAMKRIFEAGLNDRVNIVLQDYRDQTGTYDGVASIEMFEAVGEKQWPTYFQVVRGRLKPEAKATVQTITVADDRFTAYRDKVDFIQKYIFPGGMLPSAAAFSNQANAVGLEIGGKLAFGQGYSETLRQWSGRFNEAWPQIQNMGFDNRFRKMWNYYLSACAASFRYETTDVVQFTLSRR